MLLTMMRAKLHGGSVTECDLHYEGSVSIDQNLLDAAGMLAGELVHIWNVSNGNRIVTYVITAPAGSQTIGVNGAAARHFEKDDKVIIASFAQMEHEEAKTHEGTVVLLNRDNTIDRVLP